MSRNTTPAPNIGPILYKKESTYSKITYSNIKAGILEGSAKDGPNYNMT